MVTFTTIQFAMKIEALKFVLAATLLSSSAYALDAPSSAASTSNVAVATTPAPIVAPEANPAPAPNQFVYTPRLPSVADLSNAASAQGLTVDRIEQSATQIVAVYRNASGQTNTVAYQTLPPTTATTATTTTPPPTVVYESTPRVVYYYDGYDPFYYPYWYAPFSVRVGLGYGYHFHGGYGYRGGFHGGGYHHGR
jgi:hypothetical protein